MPTAPAPKALMAAELSNSSPGFSGESDTPSAPPWNRTAKPKISSPMTSVTRKTPRIFDVNSMWNHDSAVMIARKMSMNTHAGMSTLNHSLKLVDAK